MGACVGAAQHHFWQLQAVLGLLQPFGSILPPNQLEWDPTVWIIYSTGRNETPDMILEGLMTHPEGRYACVSLD